MKTPSAPGMPGVISRVPTRATPCASSMRSQDQAVWQMGNSIGFSENDLSASRA
ncbi:hypothetical protein [Paraburkholderia sp. GAS348]|uniref:hypothetical protein n=1 Tax=Paraburkholderia sp. GAS348 TaxID=3035132 RepID=UPI003D258AF8